MVISAAPNSTAAPATSTRPSRRNVSISRPTRSDASIPQTYTNDARTHILSVRSLVSAAVRRSGHGQVDEQTNAATNSEVRALRSGRGFTVKRRVDFAFTTDCCEGSNTVLEASGDGPAPSTASPAHSRSASGPGLDQTTRCSEEVVTAHHLDVVGERQRPSLGRTASSLCVAVRC